MNFDQITTPEEAVAHLFFHCCFRDGEITDNEVKVVTEMLVASGLHKTLHFKDEVVRYKAYHNKIANERDYLTTLVERIQPTNRLALYSFCVELCLSDSLLQPQEKQMMHILATVLGLEEQDETICNQLMIQRQNVEKENKF